MIIGAGISGISVALELGRLVREQRNGQKLKVVILEARDFCSGATGRNGGHLTAAISHNYSTLAKMYEPEEVKRCFLLERHTVSSILALIEQNGWGEYVNLVEGGHNVLLFSDDEEKTAKEDWEMAVEAGVVTKDQITWLTKDATEKQYGASYPMWRSAGHNLWPLKLVTKMFELARDGPSRNSKTEDFVGLADTKRGWSIGNIVGGLFTKQTTSQAESNAPPPYELVLHTHTPVHSVQRNRHSDEYKWELTTSRGAIYANKIVYATNAYTSHLVSHLTGPNGIVPVRGQVVAIRALVGYTDEGWPGGDGLSRSGWSGNEGFEYWFPRPHPRSSTIMDDNRPELQKPLIILGGARETTKDRGYGMYETDDSVLDPEASHGLRTFLGHVFPGRFPSNEQHGNEDDVEVEWSGIMGFTKSGDPFVGRLKDANGDVVEGQYIVAGFTGHGMPRVYGCAQALASLVWRDIAHPETTWTPPDFLPRHYLTETF